MFGLEAVREGGKVKKEVQIMLKRIRDEEAERVKTAKELDFVVVDAPPPAPAHAPTKKEGERCQYDIAHDFDYTPSRKQFRPRYVDQRLTSSEYGAMVKNEDLKPSKFGVHDTNSWKFKMHLATKHPLYDASVRLEPMVPISKFPIRPKSMYGRL